MLANAGGVNPHQCAKVLSELAASKGVGLNIAVVEGDDLMTKVTTVYWSLLLSLYYQQVEKMRGMAIKSMDTQADMPSNIQSMNAYLG